MSVNRILCNRDNLAREAVITASMQRGATDIRLVSQSRTGGGRMTIAGSFSGVDDTFIDIGIVSGAGGDLVASMPVVRGVGSGELSIESVDINADPDTITLALADKGSSPIAAEMEFFGVTLAARASGAGGNALAITVERNLVLTPSQYSTLESISAGTAELAGDAWNWGQPQGNGTSIPTTAFRIQFAGFPTVHRAWKTWVDNQFVYRIDPAPIYDIPENTRVLIVSGSYDLVLSDGKATETYPGVVTVFDFLSAIDTRSTLAEVRGVIALDTAPGGMSVTDIPLRTDAHALPPRGGNAVVDEVAPGAPTENIIIKPIGQVAAGQWTVSGEVSGQMPIATSGVPYTHGPVHFTLPVEAGTESNAGINAVYKPIKRTDKDAGLPAICFKPLLLGAAAVDKTVTFTWSRLLRTDCNCAHKPALRISMACLGLPGDGDGEMLDPAFQARLETLYEWRRAFVAANTTTGPDAIAVVQDLDFVDQITSVFVAAIEQAYSEPAAADLWDTYLTAMQGELAALYGIAGHLPPMVDATAAATAEEADAIAEAWAKITSAATTIQGGAVGSFFYNTCNKHYYRLDVNRRDLSTGGVTTGYPGISDYVPTTLPFYYPFGEEYRGQTNYGLRAIEPFPVDNWVTGATHILTRELPLNDEGEGKLVITMCYTDLGTAPDAEADVPDTSEPESGGENLRVNRTATVFKGKRFYAKRGRSREREILLPGLSGLADGVQDGKE
ncbi:MAG: hypothetical protein LBP58_01205, partial [Azoarcus sp.]|nr:hypothetical protein [Azoarcus sp.]